MQKIKVTEIRSESNQGLLNLSVKDLAPEDATHNDITSASHRFTTLKQ